MKRKRVLEDNELLTFKRSHIIEDDKSKEEDISDSSEDMRVEGLSLNDDSSEQLFQQQLPLLHDPFNSIMFKYLSDKDLANFARACKQTQFFASYDLEQRKTSASLLAVEQGNEAKVKSMLEINPDLLYRKEGKATDYSGRDIQNLTPFQAALCNGDIEMCEMMKDFFAQHKDGQAEIENQFNEIFPNGIEAHLQTQQDNVFDFNEILQVIIDAPEDEVTAALNKEFDNHLPLHLALEKFRKAFTEKSLSEIVFNPYHLLGAFETYNSAFDGLAWDKRDLFWRQVIGFVQRYLPACYLQAFAQGIYFIVEDMEPLKRSFDFRWGDGAILPHRGFSGLGFDFAGGRQWWSARQRGGAVPCDSFSILCRAKTSGLEELLSQRQSTGCKP
jgi:hypothetical protein